MRVAMGKKRTGVFKVICILVGFHLLAGSLANADERKTCADLIQDLKAMQQAQQQLFYSFDQKTTSIATTLDLHSENLQKAQKKYGKLKKTDFKGLNRSADALRNNQAKEAELIARFEKASSQLLDQVQSCLEKNTRISSTNSVNNTSVKN